MVNVRSNVSALGRFKCKLEGERSKQKFLVTHYNLLNNNFCLSYYEETTVKPYILMVI